MIEVFPKNEKHHLKRNLFFDGGINIARYDVVKYPELMKFTKRMRSFFWVPEEIDVTKDKFDFDNLEPHEQHIFTSNLKRQILLDSVQGRAPVLSFLPVASLPELEPLLAWWTAFETLHSESYSHIIRNIYSNPDKIFDDIETIPQIMDCGTSIARHYDSLLEYNNIITTNSYGELYKFPGTLWDRPLSKAEHKKALWLAMMSVNALEGIRFYVSFACSWAFAELKKMEGNAKIIKLIARDENLHLAITTMLLKLMAEEDPEFAAIAKEAEAEAINIFVEAIEAEKTWAAYLFKDGSIIGLNEKLLIDYIEWIGHKRMKAVGLPSPYSPGRTNPLPWTEKWIGGSNVQVAPQEVEVSSYLSGDIKNDTDKLKRQLKGFEL